MQKLDAVDAALLRDDLPDFRAGDTVKVNVKVTEGNRTRIQVSRASSFAVRVRACAKLSPSVRFPSVLVLSVRSASRPDD